MPRLRRADRHAPGITRRRSGTGFSYRDPSGAKVPAGALRDRIEALAIPPAWEDVWICPHDNGHIQATGVDAAGRRQYIYHPAWRDKSDELKFARMLELAQCLPSARGRVTRDLGTEGYSLERVRAGAFRLLDVASIRPGADSYTDQYGSYGITTLRGSHAKVRLDGVIELKFPGKSGKAWDISVEDEQLAPLVSGLKRRGPRARLFSWQDESGTWRALSPDVINAYVRECTGGEFTAKDLRTLAGTGAAALSLARTGVVEGEAAQRRAIAKAMRETAEALGNTPAVARASYVDPRVIEHYLAGRTIDPSGRRAIETELIALLG